MCVSMCVHNGDAVLVDLAVTKGSYDLGPLLRHIGGGGDGGQDDDDDGHFPSVCAHTLS